MQLLSFTPKLLTVKYILMKEQVGVIDVFL